MKRALAAAAMFLLVTACGGGKSEPRGPLSVRGWVSDIEGRGASDSTAIDVEVARRAAMFGATSVWVEKAEMVSGGFAQSGAFILLDVPPGNVTVGFNAPGAEQCHLTLQNVPAGADVFIPGIILRNGAATVVDPKAIMVRLPGSIAAPKPTGKTAIVAGFTVPVMEVPLGQMTDRRDYPEVGGLKPLATVR